MRARTIGMAAVLLLFAAVYSLGAPSTNLPVATGPQSLPGFGDTPGGHEFFLQAGSSWKGDLIVGAEVSREGSRCPKACKQKKKEVISGAKRDQGGWWGSCEVLARDQAYDSRVSSHGDDCKGVKT